jgi:SsrA-binding protein
LIGAHIAPYEQASRFNHEPTRTRKLLLHRHQIAELAGKTQTRGYTLVPLRLYLRDGLAKVELGLARGRKAHDKRRVIAERDARRELERETKIRVRL